jgi:hypothetical protein
MKNFISGLIIGLILAFSFGVIASSELAVKYFSPNIIVNGGKVELESQPVLVNGSTFLPMRELSNILGYDVTYKADSKTIELTSSTNTNEPTAIETDKNQSNLISAKELNEKFNLKFTMVESDGPLIIKNDNITIEISKEKFAKLLSENKVNIEVLTDEMTTTFDVHIINGSYFFGNEILDILK